MIGIYLNSKLRYIFISNSIFNILYTHVSVGGLYWHKSVNIDSKNNYIFSIPKEEVMTSKFKEGYLASLGIAVLTYEKATEVAKNLIKKGELAKEKQQKFITDLMEEARKNTSEVTKMLNEKIDYLAQKGEPLKDRQDKVFKDIAAKAKETGALTEIKLKDMLKEVKDKSASLKDKITGSDEDRIKQALSDLNIPTRQDLKEIKDKLDLLIEESDSKKSKKK